MNHTVSHSVCLTARQPISLPLSLSASQPISQFVSQCEAERGEQIEPWLCD